jgi:nucleoid DNA-binding protein
MEFQELICLVSEETTYTRREIRNIMRVLVKIIRKALGEGRDIHLQELGYLRNVRQAPRKGRNKTMGKIVDVPETRRLRFCPCPVLRKEVRASQVLFAEEDLAKRFGLAKEKTMEKYGVEIDPEKVPKEKRAGAGVGGKDPHPDANIPLDPDLGSEPYERRPDAKENEDTGESKR